MRGPALSCDKFALCPLSPESAQLGPLAGADMIQMPTDVVTETQEKWPHASRMSVVTSIAVSNMKACAKRLVASAQRLAQDPRADIAAERAKQTINVVEFKANLGVLKMPGTKAKAMLDIIA
jgi:hypothetical protein